MDSSNKEPDNANTEVKPTPEPTKTPDTKKPKRSLHLQSLKSKRSKTVLLLLFLLIISALGIYAYVSYSNKQADKNNPVVFTIDDKEYRADEVNPYLDEAVQKYGLDKNESLDTIIEYFKLKEVAEQYGINISEEDKRKSLSITGYAEEVKSLPQLTNWQEVIGYKIATNDHIDLKQAQSKQGYLFVFHYGNLIVPSVQYPNFENFGDEALIKRDYDYADKKSKEYKERLDKGESPDKLLEEITADLQLNYGYFPYGSFSKKFGFLEDPDFNWSQEINLLDPTKYIAENDNVNESSEIMTGRLPINENPQSDKDYLDAYKYFVYLSKSDETADEIKHSLEDMKVEKNY